MDIIKSSRLTDTDKGQHSNALEQYKAIIDTYYLNGFNGSKAVQEHRPEISYNAARVLFSSIKKKPELAQYIQDKQQQLRAVTGIQSEQITRELITWMYSDATEYIGLSVDDLKALPSEVKRCIQSVKHRVKEYTDPKGNQIKEEVLEVRIVDKTKAIEILNKMLGNYAIDNSQKANNTLNVANLNVEQLQVLTNILQQANK